MPSQPPRQTRSTRSVTVIRRCCDGTGSERRMAPSDISPVECPDSNSDIGRIRSRVTRPAPVCRVVSSGGTAEPVRMKRPAHRRCQPRGVRGSRWTARSAIRRAGAGGRSFENETRLQLRRRAASRHPCRAEPRSPRVAFRWQSSRRLGGPRTAPRRPIRVWRRGPRQRYADGIARPIQVSRTTRSDSFRSSPTGILRSIQSGFRNSIRPPTRRPLIRSAFRCRPPPANHLPRIARNRSFPVSGPTRASRPRSASSGSGWSVESSTRVGRLHDHFSVSDNCIGINQLSHDIHRRRDRLHRSKKITCESIC